MSYITNFPANTVLVTPAVTTSNLTANGANVSLGIVSNLHITGGTNGQVLQTDGTGNLTWTAQTSGGGGNGVPGGANTQVQYNNDGNFGGSAGFTFNAVTNAFSVPGNITGVNVITTSITANGNVTLGAVANVHIAGGSNLQFLQTDGTGNLAWSSVSTSSISNGNSNVSVLTNANVTVSSAGNANVVVVTGTGANVAGTANITGNLTAGNVTTVAVTANGNIELSGANVSLGAVGNLHITGGSNLQFLQTDGAGNLTWATTPAQSSIANGNTYISIAEANGNITGNIAGNSAILLTTTNDIILGRNAGVGSTRNSTVIIGYSAGANNDTGAQGMVVVGQFAGRNVKDARTVAIGSSAGSSNAGTLWSGVVVGGGSGTGLGNVSNIVAVGEAVGTDTGNSNWVAVGSYAGTDGIAEGVVAVGVQSGYRYSGQNSIYIGLGAGANGAGGPNTGGNGVALANVIVLNATGANLNPDPLTTGNAFFVKPIRDSSNSNTSISLFYTVATGEITYGPTGGVAFPTFISNGNTTNASPTDATFSVWSAANTNGAHISANLANGLYSILGISNTKVSIGYTAGSIGDQGLQAIAIGVGAGNTTQSADAVAIGNSAGRVTQGLNSIAIGSLAAYSEQGANGIALGSNAARNYQGVGAIAIGNTAAYGWPQSGVGQGNNAIAIGNLAAGSATSNLEFQHEGAIAIGYRAGYDTQGANAIAIGVSAGYNLQGNGAIAIGQNSGGANGEYTVCIGSRANPLDSLGNNSILIGYGAGTDNGNIGSNVILVGTRLTTNSSNNTIILNASGANLNGNTSNSLFISPIRNETSNNNNISNIMFYNPTSKEVTYSNTISITGTLNVGNLVNNGTSYINHTTSEQGTIQFSDGQANSFVVQVGNALTSWAGAGSLNMITSSSPGANIGFFVAQNERGRFTPNGFSVAGALTVSANANLGNSAIANFFIGSGANLANIPAANIVGNLSNATGINANVEANTTATLGNLVTLVINGVTYKLMAV